MKLLLVAGSSCLLLEIPTTVPRQQQML